MVDEATIRTIERPHRNLLAYYGLQSLSALFLAPFLFVPLLCKYLTLRYRIDDEGVSASWGVLFRREIHLTYRRIQDIHVSRNLFERWLGIGKVEIQTASGNATAELSLEGMQAYEDVRDFLYTRMRGTSSAAGTAEAVDEGEGPHSAPDGTGEVLELLRGIRSELEQARRALEQRG